MRRLLLLLVFSTLLFHNCSKDSRAPRSVEEILPGDWIIDVIAIKTFVSDSIISNRVVDKGGSMFFEKNGSGSLIYADGTQANVLWELIDESHIDMTLSDTLFANYEILASKENRQKWDGVYDDGQGNRLEISVRLSRE